MTTVECMNGFLLGACLRKPGNHSVRAGATLKCLILELERFPKKEEVIQKSNPQRCGHNRWLTDG